MSDAPQTGPSERPDEFIDEIMRRDAELAVREPVEVRKKSPGRLLLLLAPIAVVLIVWNIVMSAGDPEVFTVDEQEAAAKTTLFLVAQGLLVHRDSAGSLPATLEEIDLDEEGLTYRRNYDSYTLTVEANGKVFTYRSGDDLSGFAAAFATFLSEEGQ